MFPKFLLLLCLIGISFSGSAERFLVTRSHDTVRFVGDLETDHQQYAHWTKFGVNGTTYSLSDIRYICLDSDYYANIRFRRIWKRVVKGRLNVYALQVEDTSRDDKGHVKKQLYIQGNTVDEPIAYQAKNLYRLLSNSDSLRRMMGSQLATSRGGKALMTGGIVKTAASTFTLLVEGMLVLLETDVDEMEVLAAGSAMGLGTGLAGIITGLKINKNSKQLNLDPVYYINAQP